MSQLQSQTCFLGLLPLVEIFHPLVVGAEISEGAEMEGGRDSEVVVVEEGTVLTGEEGENYQYIPTTPSEIMKGTKVLTLGAGREVLPHNMAVTKM